MGAFDFLNGINEIIDSAECLCMLGRYREALNKLDEINSIQFFVISKEQFVRQAYLTAKCYYKLKDYKTAIKMVDYVINYPGYNHNYISKAEALKKEIQKYV